VKNILLPRHQNGVMPVVASHQAMEVLVTGHQVMVSKWRDQHTSDTGTTVCKNYQLQAVKLLAFPPWVKGDSYS